jgi:glycosyltransferase involved in cell wall biosynthesis
MNPLNLRVLHLIPDLYRGGAERMALDMVQHLARIDGVEVRLATLRDENGYQEEYPEIQPIVTHAKVLPSIKGKWTVQTEQYEALLKEFKPHVVHSHLYEAEWVAHVQPKPNIAYFTHCHDNMRQLRPWSWSDLSSKLRWTEAYERAHLFRAYQKVPPVFLAISSDTQTYFQNVLPQSLRNRVVALDNAIDVQRFLPFRAHHQTTPFTIVNIGSFVAKKNQRFLLDIAEACIARNIDIRVEMYGTGPLHAEVVADIERRNLTDRVVAPGQVPQVQQRLAGAQAYVHTATYVPFGLVMLEAMACGLPVLALDGQGNRKLHKQGDNGWMFTSQDPQAFADKIFALSTQKDLWSHCAAGALATAKQFDFVPYTQKLHQLYVEAAK